jgi:methylmalonyl-CoA/ethylmalonyl-CoA epimerase
VFKWVDHLVIAVNNLEQAVQTYETKLGLKAENVGREQPQLGLRNAILPLDENGRFIELAEPLGPDTPVGRSLQRRGEGLHLAAIAVEDLAEATAELKRRGVQLIEAGGVFIHPRETHGILFQLVERK